MEAKKDIMGRRVLRLTIKDQNQLLPPLEGSRVPGRCYYSTGLSLVSRTGTPSWKKRALSIAPDHRLHQILYKLENSQQAEGRTGRSGGSGGYS